MLLQSALLSDYTCRQVDLWARLAAATIIKKKKKWNETKRKSSLMQINEYLCGHVSSLYLCGLHLCVMVLSMPTDLSTSHWPHKPLTRLLLRRLLLLRLTPAAAAHHPVVESKNFRCPRRWWDSRSRSLSQHLLLLRVQMKLKHTDSALEAGDFAYDYTKFASHYFVSGPLGQLTLPLSLSLADRQKHVAWHTNELLQYLLY